jgi:hypothetical protein
MGLIAFHGQTDVHMAKGRMWLVDQWPAAELKPGDNVIYFALNEKELSDKLRPLFRKVTTDAEPRLFTKDADIPTRTLVFRCESYKAGLIP